MTKRLQDKIDSWRYSEEEILERVIPKDNVDKAIQELREEILKLELLYVNSADAFTIRRREVLALIGEKK